jgi:hypothetical protein
MAEEKPLSVLLREYDKAQKAWNRDNGPLEHTVKAGEELYFSSLFLIERLRDDLEAALAKQPA